MKNVKQDELVFLPLGGSNEIGMNLNAYGFGPADAKGLGEQALARLLEGGWLKPGALAVFERGSDEPDVETPGYERLDARDYGAARVLFLRALPTAD